MMTNSHFWKYVGKCDFLEKWLKCFSFLSRKNSNPLTLPHDPTYFCVCICLKRPCKIKWIMGIRSYKLLLIALNLTSSIHQYISSNHDQNFIFRIMIIFLQIWPAKCMHRIPARCRKFNIYLWCRMKGKNKQKPLESQCPGCTPAEECGENSRNV